MPPAPETDDALAALRDTLRSARRWRELLSDADRRALLADIARVGLAAGRDLYGGLSDLDVGASPSPATPCPVERLAFLSGAAGGIMSALGRLESEPPPTLTVGARLMPVERARRIGATALRALVQKPFASGVLRVRETVLIPDADTPPLRAVKTIAAIWARDLAGIVSLALDSGENEIATDAERVRVRFARILRRPFWRDLPLAPRVAPIAAAQLRSGAHRLLHDIYNRYRDGFAWDWAHPLFRLPVRETWLLYEYWCLFAVIDCLHARGFTAVDSTLAVRTVRGLTLTLATDAESRITLRRGARTVTVTYQKRFDRGDPDTPGFHSRAQTLIPDITVAAGDRLFILDAKFKTYVEPGAETGDIRQMHAYRDAIRRSDARPVAAAWLLFAARADGVGRGIIAYPQTSAALPLGNGEVGALRTRPGETGAVGELLARFLGLGQ